MQPSDADLQSFLQAHKAMFQTEPLLSFRQIYFNPQLHGVNLHRDAARLLDRLRSPGSHKSEIDAGDPFLLQEDFDHISPADLKNTFGEKFASAISALPVGSWQGPIDSGYGAHLVYVAKNTPSRLPDLADVREQVRRDYFDARRREATDKFYTALLHRYSVRIEPPEEKKEGNKEDEKEGNKEDKKEEKKLGQLR
jgi:hypothetical protein